MIKDALNKAVQAAIDYLNTSEEYVGNTDDPTDVCLDGWFNIEQLVTEVLKAFTND